MAASLEKQSLFFRSLVLVSLETMEALLKGWLEPSACSPGPQCQSIWPLSRAEDQCCTRVSEPQIGGQSNLGTLIEVFKPWALKNKKFMLREQLPEL